MNIRTCIPRFRFRDNIKTGVTVAESGERFVKFVQPWALVNMVCKSCVFNVSLSMKVLFNAVS